MVAHLDTVFPEGTDVTVRREGNRLIAPGIGDDTRGLALMLTVIRAMLRAGVKTRGDALFVASVGEEGLGDLRGVKHLFREGGPRIDQFIAVDGGSTDRVLNRAIGSYRYKITFKGPGGHSWGAFGLGNPAHALSRFIHFFDEEAGELVISGPKTTYNVGRIGGGTSVNAIPFENWAEVDMRSEDPRQLDKIDAILKRAVDRALEEQNERRRRGEPLTVAVEMLGNRPSGTADPSSPLIQRALAATRHFGVEPQLDSGSTDANVPISLGIPATTIGRGGEGDGAHSLHEWWSNVDGHLGIQKALLLLVASTGVPK
jgi:acetylornithine deacetylase/succinyl-diaminopimelate desuccinylase-like protein